MTTLIRLDTKPSSREQILTALDRDGAGILGNAIQMTSSWLRSTVFCAASALLLLISPAAAEQVLRFESSGILTAGFGPDLAGLNGASFELTTIANIGDAVSTGASTTTTTTSYAVLAGVLQLTNTVGGTNDGIHSLLTSGTVGLFSPTASSSSTDDIADISATFAIGGVPVGLLFSMVFDGRDFFDQLGPELQMRGFESSEPLQVFTSAGNGDTTYSVSGADPSATDQIVNAFAYSLSSQFVRVEGSDPLGLGGADYTFSTVVDGASPIATGSAGSTSFTDFPLRSLELEVSGTVGGANDGIFPATGVATRVSSSPDSLVDDRIFFQTIVNDLFGLTMSITHDFTGNDFFPDSPPRIVPFSQSDIVQTVGSAEYPLDALFGLGSSTASLNEIQNPGIVYTLTGTLDRTGGGDFLGIDNADFVLTTIIDDTAPAATTSDASSDTAVYMSVSQILDISGTLGGAVDGRYVAKTSLGRGTVDTNGSLGTVDVSAIIEILGTPVAFDSQLLFSGTFIATSPPDFPAFENSDVLLILGGAEYASVNTFDFALSEATAVPESGVEVVLYLGLLMILGGYGWPRARTRQAISSK